MASNCASIADIDSIIAIAPTDAERFGIAELSREFGITPRALRFYEEEGLIAPARHGATRVYSRRDRFRVSWILQGKAMGFGLDEIAELLDLYDVGDGGAAQREATALRCRAKADDLRQRIAELATMIDRLGRFAAQIEADRT